MCSCTASEYFVLKALEKILVDGELGDNEGDDDLGDGVAFFLNQNFFYQYIFCSGF